jgi:hypothetical protein
MKPYILIGQLVLALTVAAQQPGAATAPASSRASVTFSFEWDQGFPWQKYSIAVQAGGKAHFEGVPHAGEAGDTSPFQQDFTMSEANQRKIFALAGKLNYFHGDYDSHKKRIAHTGKKTLAYDSPQARGTTTYDWSQNPDVQELTRTFQNISVTLDYGRKLAYQLRFDRLGMSERLRQLEELEAGHEVAELQAIAPILRKIADDPDMMHISQLSALHLLKTINGTGAKQNSAQP